jgi:hypothetical protein
MEGVDPMTPTEDMELIDAAKEAVVVAEKAWRVNCDIPEVFTLRDAVDALRDLEAAAIRALPGQKKGKDDAENQKAN